VRGALYGSWVASGVAVLAVVGLLAAHEIGRLSAVRTLPWIGLALVASVGAGVRFSLIHGVWHAPTFWSHRFVAADLPLRTRIALILIQVVVATTALVLFWYAFALG